MQLRTGSGGSTAAALGVVDVLVLGAIWLAALVVGGSVAFDIAKLCSLVGVLAWVVMLIPRTRCDEAYVRTVRRALSGPRVSRRLQAGGIGLGRLGYRVCLLVAAVATIFVSGAFARAPSTDELPVARGVSVIASAAGGSDVDTANDRRRYRYVFLAGRRGETEARVLRDEAARLLSSGWACTTQKLVHLKHRGERYALLPHPCRTSPPRSSVTLISTLQGLRADLTVVRGQVDADQQADVTPLEGNRGVRLALRDQHPILWVVLAQEP